MNVLGLCAGIGGLELGIKIAEPSARTICYVEYDRHAQSVIKARIRDKSLDDAPIWDDVKTFDGKPWRGLVDVLCGGYPCQPFSLAGKYRLGDRDPRHLWPHIAKIIDDVRPKRCFFENVAGHLSLGFRQVADELFALGYQVTAGIFTASEVGAPHERERLYIMANADESGTWLQCKTVHAGNGSACKTNQSGRQARNALCSVRAMPMGYRLQAFPPGIDDKEGWAPYSDTKIEPTVLGMADGISRRVDRLARLGNAVCPLVAAYAWRTLQTAFD